MSANDCIIEFLVQGRYVKVTAIDPTTGTEAVIVGDPTKPQQLLAQIAVRKLERLLKQPPKVTE